MTKSTAGLFNTVTLVASGIGGLLFGFIADRLGRKPALMLSILTYSVCSFASGLNERMVGKPEVIRVYWTQIEPKFCR